MIFWRLLDSRILDIRLVGQAPAPSKCILLSTSAEVRGLMKDWILSDTGDKWSVKLDTRDLGGIWIPLVGDGTPRLLGGWLGFWLLF